MAAGLHHVVTCIASLVIRGWNIALNGLPPDALQNRLGIAIAIGHATTWQALLESDRWVRLAKAGALPPRLLWDDTATGHPPAWTRIEALSATDTSDAHPWSAAASWRAPYPGATC